MKTRVLDTDTLSASGKKNPKVVAKVREYYYFIKLSNCFFIFSISPLFGFLG